MSKMAGENRELTDQLAAVHMDVSEAPAQNQPQPLGQYSVIKSSSEQNAELSTPQPTGTSAPQTGKMETNQLSAVHMGNDPKAGAEQPASVIKSSLKHNAKPSPPQPTQPTQPTGSSAPQTGKMETNQHMGNDPKALAEQPASVIKSSLKHNGTNAAKTTPAARSAAPAADLSEKAAKHVNAWRKIFKRWDWLEAAHAAKANPVLLGYGVSSLYYNRDEPIHLILLSMDWTYEIIERGKEFLFDCLQDFDWVDKKSIRLRNTNITIYIDDAVEGNADYTVVSDYNHVLHDDYTIEVLYYTGLDEPERLQTEPYGIDVVTYKTPDDVVGKQWFMELYFVELSLCEDANEPGITLGWAIEQIAPPETYQISTKEPNFPSLIPLDSSTEPSTPVDQKRIEILFPILQRQRRSLGWHGWNTSRFKDDGSFKGMKRFWKSCQIDASWRALSVG